MRKLQTVSEDPLSTFPARCWIETNGIEMATYLYGPEDGPAVILCHGWPELAWSWREQIIAIGKAGYRVIAPDMRGYGHTGGPKGIDAVPLYDMDHLTGDLVGLMDALDINQAVIVGHDWGGTVAWQMPLLHPERTAGVIGVNMPFIPRLPRDPVESLRALFGDSMYMVRFQAFGEAEEILQHDTARSLRFLLRRSSHTAESWAERSAVDRNLSILDALQKSEAEWGGRPLLTSGELDVYREGFELSGWEGGINWYRNLSRNWQQDEEIEQRVFVPSLMVSGANDVILPPSLCEGMEKYVPDLERHVIADCGHWTLTEKSAELNALMVGWLDRRFNAHPLSPRKSRPLD